MSEKRTGEEVVREVFAGAEEPFKHLAARFIDGAETAVEEAREIFERMIPGMAYIDRPRHPMASSVFGCAANLALYLALKERGVDAHGFGVAMLQGMATGREREPAPAQPADDRPVQERFAGFLEAANESQSEAESGEFVFEAFLGDRKDSDWGMNVKSCAICSLFAQHDAMDLVPYMCATDDVESDLDSQGLRRSGTIALGASQCDFRYKRGGEPLRLIEQYPEQIRSADD
jgi:hypothetical protein